MPFGTNGPLSEIFQINVVTNFNVSKYRWHYNKLTFLTLICTASYETQILQRNKYYYLSPCITISLQWDVLYLKKGLIEYIV